MSKAISGISHLLMMAPATAGVQSIPPGSDAERSSWTVLPDTKRLQQAVTLNMTGGQQRQRTMRCILCQDSLPETGRTATGNRISIGDVKGPPQAVRNGTRAEMPMESGFSEGKRETRRPAAGRMLR